MRYAITTLGCKVNQFETQAIEAILADNGFLPADECEAADLIIINTCAVTAESGRKSRQAVRRLKSENPNAVCAVCGCFSQLSPGDAAELGADVVHGSGDKKRFIDDIMRALDDRRFYSYIDDPFARRVFEELPGGAVGGRTRAMLKIQDGCVNFCTYCIIPYTRGRLRSLPLESCAAQTEALASEGYRELVVTGIEIASYGRDLAPAKTLADAVEAIAETAGDMRIRLGSLEPTVITEDFCKRLAASGKVCNHFHLSLQSGCDETLKRMGRKYDTSRFYESVLLLRGTFPGCAITADLITGFPGETPREFSQTLEFIEKCAFASMHIFPYSERAGTKAAGLPGRVPLKERERRSHEASLIASAMRRTYLEGQIGSVQNVLYESRSGSVSYGHAPNNAVVSAQGDLRGRIVPTLITGSDGTALQGEPISGSARREERG